MRTPLDPRITRACHVLLQHRISPQQAVILSACASDAPPTMTVLSTLCCVTTAAMTGSIDRMVRRGWINREHSTDDRRSITLELTSLGAAVIAKLNNAISTL
jgi:DNA-binding MarR family transcriptional regulator